MIERVAMTWLVNALWLVPLIAATAAVSTRFGRLGPRGRHGAWMAALVLAVSLPALPAALLPVRLAPVAHSLAVSQPARAGDLPDRAAIPGAAAPAADLPLLLALDQTWTRAVLCLAGLVVAISLCRLLVAIGAGRGLVRAATPHDLDPDIRDILGRVVTRASRSPPLILESEAIASPVVVGAMRPAILVPTAFGHLPWDEQRAALLHELAHVARRDYAWNLVCEVVSLPLAWHPAVLPIKAGIRRSREVACDALAARAMASPMTYAKCLVSLAGRLGAVRPTSAIVVGLIGKSDLEERLMTLLNPRPDRLTAALRMAGAAGLAAAVLAPAVFFRVTPAFADETVVPRRMLVSGSVAPAGTASPAPAVAPAPPAAARPGRKAPVATVPRVASIQSEAPVAPPAPLPPPPPPSAFVLAAPPAPPAPPAAMQGVEIREYAGHGRYDVIVRRALEQALSAEKVKERDEIRRALAELRTQQLQRVRTDEARIHADVAAAVAEFDRAHVEKTLDQLRSRLQSPEFRNALAAAEHGAARAAAVAKADDGND